MPTSTTDVKNKAEDAMEQIAELRAQVEALMREKAAGLVGHTVERVEAAAHDASDLARERAEALAVMVRERPLSSVLIAAAVGFLFGRAGR
jgi:ElaB/YqjD/DUF883 family membrane-anchored ribosome-binding protein